MVIGLAKQDNIPIIECVGTVTEAAQRFEVTREWVMYLVKFDKISSRKSGGTWLVDLHSLAQFIELYRSVQNVVDTKKDKLYP